MQQQVMHFHRSMAAMVLLGLLLALSGCARPVADPSLKSSVADCVRDPAIPLAPPDIRYLSNPLPMTAENLAAGRRLYEELARPQACVQCHGINGDGLGPLAHRLDPAPPNFTCDFYRDIPDGQLFWITREGSSMRTTSSGHLDVRRPGRASRTTAMQAHRYFLTEEETWQVIAHLRSFHAEVQ